MPFLSSSFSPLRVFPALSHDFLSWFRRSRRSPVALPVARAPVLLFADLLQRPAPTPTYPIADRPDDAVRHPQHNDDEERAHEELPELRQHAAEHEFETLDEERADEGADQGRSPAHGGPDHAVDRESRTGIEERHDADPGRIQRARRRRHE